MLFLQKISLRGEVYRMLKLNNSKKSAILDHFTWYEIWQTMNEVKPVYLIPGLNMMSTYQLSEYFDVPIRLIKKLEAKYHLGDPLTRRCVTGTEIGFFSIGRTKVIFEGVTHWQYNFGNFSAHAANVGTVCYAPTAVESFLPYFTDSKVCSAILDKLSEKLAEREKIAAKRKKAEEEAKDLEIKRAVGKALAELKIDQPTVTVKVAVGT